MNDGTLPHRQDAVPARTLISVHGRPATDPGWGADYDFELNTDAALVDQRWADSLDQHERRYGLAIEHLKARVKGRSYDNDAMRLRVGANGYYAQSQYFPAAFFGDTAKASVNFITDQEATMLVWEAVAHYRAEETQSLTAVYAGDEPPDFFFGYRVNEWRRYEIGFLRTAPPQHLRVLFDADSEVPMLGAASGVLIYQRTRGGKHVVVKAPGRRQPLLGVTALG